MDVIANIADNYSQAQMIGLGAGFIALPIVAVALRLSAKLLGRRGLAWDDYLIFMALESKFCVSYTLSSKIQFSACFIALLFVQVSFVCGSILASRHEDKQSFEDRLHKHLSPGATITSSDAGAPRWSEYYAPQPGIVVNVATEADVQVVVRYQFPASASSSTEKTRTVTIMLTPRCLSLGRLLPEARRAFPGAERRARWIDSFHLHRNGVLINMRGLNDTTLNPDKTQATVGGGALIGESVAQAFAADTQVLTGGCNCVGMLGATLGGGYGNLMGEYGLSVDQVLSMNVVTADGKARTITAAADADLWWALLGAGPNFGIVTSAVIKAYLIPQAQNTAWLGGLFYTHDKIEQVVQAIQDLTLEKEMSLFLYYTTSGAPSYTPTVLVTPFYYGTEAAGRAAFRSLLNIGPYTDTTSVLPYSEWNAGADGFCIKGDRKPSYGVGFDQMVPATWRQVWNAFTAFLQHPGTENTSVLVECYSLAQAQAIGSSTTSFANRDVRFNGIAIAWYANASLDPIAEAFGSQVRDLWRSTANLGTNRTYINFAHGDENNDVVYGDSLSRLQGIKKQYDPNNAFKQWLDIQS